MDGTILEARGLTKEFKGFTAVKEVNLQARRGTIDALLGLGLAVIFGMLNVINFAHGALYMIGAFVAWLLLTKWKKTMLSRLYKL